MTKPLRLSPCHPPLGRIVQSLRRPSARTVTTRNISSIALSGVFVTAMIGVAAGNAAAGETSGFSKLPLQESGVKVRIQVPSHGCVLGDWDAITMERGNSDNKRLLLSIEPIGPDSSFKPIVKEITNFDLSKGFATTFTFPKVSTPTPLALYICKDADNKGSCTGKEATDIAKVMRTYTIPIPGDSTGKNLPEMPKPKKATDKIYYFGALVLDGSAVHSLKNDVVQKQSADVGAELAKLGVKQSDKVLSEVKKLDGEIRSDLPQAEGSTLTINLPHMDPAACIPKS